MRVRVLWWLSLLTGRMGRGRVYRWPRYGLEGDHASCMARLADSNGDSA